MVCFTKCPKFKNRYSTLFLSIYTIKTQLIKFAYKQQSISGQSAAFIKRMVFVVLLAIISRIPL